MTTAAACVVFGLGQAVSAQPGPRGVETTYWNQHGLAVPYRWAGRGDVRSASQVVLYYSADRGRSWQTASTAAPHVRSFMFQAPGDGEYWFAVRTYAQSGAYEPPGPLQAEMRVLVDTKIPRVERLEGTLDGGVVTARIEASDSVEIDPAATRLYAQADGRGGWSPVTLTPDSASSAGAVRLVGVWRPPVGAVSIALRAAVQDRAGNRAERSATVDAPQGLAGPRLGGASNNRPLAPPTTGVDPFATAEANSPSLRSDPQPVANPFGRATEPPPATGWASSTRSTPERESLAAQPWPSESRRTQMPVAPPEQRGASRSSQTSPFSQASLGGWDAGADGAGRDRSAADAATRALDADAPLRRFVSSPEFEFDYELDRTGRWGVAKVELWGTDNGGRSWRRMAIDSDRQSPIHVTTPAEGEYGFQIVVESVGGLEPVTPRPGDAPDAVVVVDQRLPRAVLNRVEQGSGYFADQLSIEWRVDDEHLAPQAIDLYYSNRPTGPWAPIATSLSNSGRHSWRLQRHLPRELYVRLEARDSAGNLGVATTPQPITLELPQARGSLGGVRPAGDSY